MPRGIPGSGSVKTKYFVCTEAFSVTVYDSIEDETMAHHYNAMPPAEVQKLKEEKGLQVPRGEDLWFRAGQRVTADHRVFQGPSGENRRHRLFIPEDESPEYGGGLERLSGRAKTEATS